MPYRDCVLANAVVVTASGADAIRSVRLPEPAQAACFTQSITTASGTLITVIQRGRRTMNSTDTITTSNETLIWEDHIAFTSTTTTGIQQIHVTCNTTTANIHSQSVGAGQLPHGHWVGPPLGPGPFRLYYTVSGASPSFTVTVNAEFEWL